MIPMHISAGEKCNCIAKLVPVDTSALHSLQLFLVYQKITIHILFCVYGCSSKGLHLYYSGSNMT
jgi:hypothetical protein